MSNTFGLHYRLTSFGESHGRAIGGIIDGMPAGVAIDHDALARAMARRRPGGSAHVSQRREPDEVTFLSGIFNGITLGTPIAFEIANRDAHSADYDELRNIYRPSHADYTYQMKYGIRDHRGGGRASARETAVRVVAGELARQALATTGISVHAAIDQPADLPSRIDEAIRTGNTIGGTIRCRIAGVPAGLGEPLYDKFQARLAYAMMSIPAAKGFDYGDGFDGILKPGSEWLDRFVPGAEPGSITVASNHSGGIQGGITNGAEITFRVAFKPVATMMRPTESTDSQGRTVCYTPRGRHDVCVLPRAVPVVEAMAWMVTFDMWLAAKLSRI